MTFFLRVTEVSCIVKDVWLPVRRGRANKGGKINNITYIFRKMN